MKKGVLKKQAFRKYSDFEKFYENIKNSLETRSPLIEFRFFKERKILSVTMGHITRVLAESTLKQVEKVKKLCISYIFEELK